MDASEPPAVGGRWALLRTLCCALGCTINMCALIAFSAFSHNPIAAVWAGIALSFSLSVLAIASTPPPHARGSGRVAAPILIAISAVCACAALCATVAYIVVGVKEQERVDEHGHFVAAVWSFMALKWSVALFIALRRRLSPASPSPSPRAMTAIMAASLTGVGAHCGAVVFFLMAPCSDARMAATSAVSCTLAAALAYAAHTGLVPPRRGDRAQIAVLGALALAGMLCGLAATTFFIVRAMVGEDSSRATHAETDKEGRITCPPAAAGAAIATLIVVWGAALAGTVVWTEAAKGLCLPPAATDRTPLLADTAGERNMDNTNHSTEVHIHTDYLAHDGGETEGQPSLVGRNLRAAGGHQ